MGGLLGERFGGSVRGQKMRARDGCKWRRLVETAVKRD